MNRAPFRSSASNRGVIDAWPWPREPQRREYPYGNPTHPRLVAHLCPLRCTITADQHDRITWASIAPLCK